ncbi:MAG: glycosyltransferase family 9 protein [Desulfovibrionaceae bacterium]|nr:glycosyltransferase family 9 protein [Desulfovibrionaceae bacterium]
MTKYLVIQAARLGDLVQTKRLILSLKLKGEVHLLLDKDLTSLASLLYPEVVLYPFHFHKEMNATRLEYNRKILQRLAKEQFDQIYNCNYSGMTATICRLFEQEALGYRPNRASKGGILRSPLLRLVSSMTARRCSATFNLVDLWGHFTREPLKPELVNPKIQSLGQGIGVVLAGREERRSLPAAILAEIVSVYSHLKGHPKIYLLGTTQEKAQSYQLRRSLPASLQTQIEDLTGKTSLVDLKEILGGLELLLTPDTGTMHLAAALGLPVRAFFLSSALCHETGPYGEGHVVFQAAPSCAPCLEKSSCRNQRICLTPFKSREFLRTIAFVEQHKKLAKPLQDLQVFKSSLDELGLYFELIEGEDPHKDERALKRQFLADFLQVELKKNLVELKKQDLAQIWQLWGSDLEWMLPSQRYA